MPSAHDACWPSGVGVGVEVPSVTGCRSGQERLSRSAAVTHQDHAIRLAIAIQHADCEDCGTLTDVLRARGFELRYVKADSSDLQSLDGADPDLLISLGGPASVYDVAQQPWITQELRLFEQRVRAEKPVLGICFGAQILSKVLGARVYAAPVKELGWKPLRLTNAGESSFVQLLGPLHTSMLHWHGDTFDLPQGALLHASTAEVENQIYTCGDNVLALQCHPEVRANDLEQWLIAYADEVAATTGVTEAQLRADTLRFGPALELQSSALFQQWLSVAFGRRGDRG